MKGPVRIVGIRKADHPRGVHQGFIGGGLGHQPVQLVISIIAGHRRQVIGDILDVAGMKSWCWT